MHHACDSFNSTTLISCLFVDNPIPVFSFSPGKIDSWGKFGSAVRLIINMGKNMNTRHSDDEVHGFGQAFLGFVHIFDYHHWRSSLKRMLLQKVNTRKRLKGKTRAKELDNEEGEHQKLVDEDNAKESKVKQKWSLKARIKSLIAEEISKEGKRGSTHVSPEPMLKRTYSIHHLEPPDPRLPEICTDWESPIFFFSNNKDNTATKLWDLQNKEADSGGKKSREPKNKDVKFNRNLFLENLQDTNAEPRRFSRTLSGSRTLPRLDYSGSYPSPRLAQKRELEPSTLKQKHIENWPFVPKMEKLDRAMHIRSKSLPSDYNKGRKFGQALSFLLDTSTESDESNMVQSEEIEEHQLTRSRGSYVRSSSLNESLDRYTRLFSNDTGKEATFGSSRSLRLRNEKEMASGGNGPVLLGRICSLSQLESYSLIPNGMDDDSNLKDQVINAEEGSFSTREAKSIGNIQEFIREYESLENVDSINQVAATAEINEEADALNDSKSDSFREKAIESAEPHLVPEAELHFPEEMSSSSLKVEDSEGRENRCDHFEVQNLESLANLKHDDCELDKNYRYTDLDYVKILLEYSGFAKDALHKPWFSANQPIGPSVFADMEAYWHKELELSSEECSSCYHHQLIFDVVNDKLLSIYDRAYTYYPEALSSNCRVLPFPVGDSLVDEICKSVNTLMGLRPEQRQSLESIVGLDIRDDGWMNLQWESECLGLEIEDNIFDELMEDLEDMIFEEVFGS